jgi:hypothetical protein
MSAQLKIIIEFGGHKDAENILGMNTPLNHLGFSSAC